ncbi:pyruvate synthase subunit beta [candidate division KSB1 bacterium]|nr:pyruvate synthase subunit beta [candidate division KSB1 bacterium]
MFEVYERRNFIVPEDEIMTQGHLGCPGCGATMSMRLALKALGRKTILIIPACCWAVIDGPFPYSAAGVPVLQCAFETAAISASGVRAGLDVQGKSDVQVVAWAGDGGTFDIGLGALSAAAERNENIIYVCYDNEAYMNTGIQRSSATPWGAWTTTTPARHPKSEPKKDLMGIFAAHRIPYAATATVAYPDDLIQKFKKAVSIKDGLRLLHLFSACPPGHKSLESESVKIMRLAVQTRVFPLYEVENGEKWTLTVESEGVPVNEYLKLQGRFRHLSETDREKIQEEVNGNWKRLMEKVKKAD